MKGDKVRRMQAVRKWLEKAERSYSAHREISGEMNLIMAQAEMQRLKESDRAMERRKTWYIRGLSLMAAFCIAGGISFFQSAPGTEKALMAEPEVTISKARPGAGAAASSGEAPHPAALMQQDAADFEERSSPVKEAISSPAEERMISAAPAAAPVLSQEEIQSVVGEAGRALRGQP